MGLSSARALVLTSMCPAAVRLLALRQASLAPFQLSCREGVDGVSSIHVQ